MDVPLSLVAKSLKGFCVCYFKNLSYDEKAPPHYFVTVPINDELSLLVCVITSQIENKLWFYHKTNEKAIQSLVRVDKNSLPFLKKESVIECNLPLLISRHEFTKIVDPKYKFKVVARDIPSEIKKNIIKAINNSPIVKPFIKKMLIQP